MKKLSKEEAWQQYQERMNPIYKAMGITTPKRVRLEEFLPEEACAIMCEFELEKCQHKHECPIRLCAERFIDKEIETWLTS